MDPDDSGVAFRTRLARFLLVSYAAGDDVEGEWTFVSPHGIVPTVRATVSRVDPGWDETVTDATVTSVGPDPFEQRLEALLLGAYARGDDVAGQWRIRYAREELPEWWVEVEIRDVEPESTASAEDDLEPGSAADTEGDAGEVPTDGAGGSDDRGE